MKNLHKHLFILIFLFNFQLFNATTTTKEDPVWNILRTSVISPDGQWLLYRKAEIAAKNSPTAILVNTSTKQRNEFHDPELSMYKGILNDNYAIIKKGQTLSIIDLLTNKTIEKKEEILQYDVEPTSKILFTLNLNGELIIEEVNRKTNKIIFETINVKKYFLNNSKSYLVYQDNSKEKNLYKIDLQTYKNSFITKLNQDLQDLQWNIDENIILFNLKEEKNLHLVNLLDNTNKEIQMPEGKLTDFKKHFYSNNDLLLTYNVQSSDLYPESTYLDTWSSNARELRPSNFNPKYKYSYVAKHYSYETGKQIELERSRLKEYLPISIPGYVLTFDPTEGQDFLNTYKKDAYYLENIKTKQRVLLTKIRQLPLSISPDNTKLLYQKDNSDNWEVMDPKKNKRITIDHDQPFYLPPYWSTDSKSIYYINNNNLIRLDLESQRKTKLTNFKRETSIQIINLLASKNGTSNIDSTKPILIKVSSNNENAIFKITKNKITTISPFSLARIEQIRLSEISDKADVIIWTEQDYNIPETIFMSKKNKKSVLVESEIPKEWYNWRKRKLVRFKDSKGVELVGFLYYPKNFDSSKKYPMITQVYDKVWSSPQLIPNKFIIPTYLNGAGHNRTQLNELGYFVFTPDTYVDERGPGLTALDCVESGISEVLQIEPAINKDKIGLYGFSFGGYKASFIAAHSNLFAAIVSAAGIQDLIGSYTYKFNLNRYLPEYSRVENAQFSMLQSFAENPQKYYDNSPLLHAQKIKTPILLFTGLEDDNVHWEQTRTMFLALKRYNNTQFVALFYNGIGHGFDYYLDYQKPLAKDYTIRYMDWWNYYLKEDKSIKWIDEAVNTSKVSYLKTD